jgi:tetratricopeptide (TPR) repeat protein
LRALLVAFALLFSSCACCLHFNHWYNAKGAFQEAERLREARSDSISVDSVWVTGVEKLQLERAIEKGSRILERWPEEADYKPLVLFLMAESYMRLGTWDKAVRKYDEYGRYFATEPDWPAVQFHRAFCLHRQRETGQARFALEPLVADSTHPFHAEALDLLSRIAGDDPSNSAAIVLLRKLVEGSGGSPLLRAQARMRLARLLFETEQYAEATQHLQHPDMEQLPLHEQFEAQLLTIRCQYKQGDLTGAIAQARKLVGDKRFAPEQLRSTMLLGTLLLQSPNPAEGVDLLTELASDHPTTPLASEAWYQLGLRLEEKVRDYHAAVADYDSSARAAPASPWGTKSRERREVLLKLIRFSGGNPGDTTRKTPEAGVQFQLAELFLFSLDRTDTALQILDTLLARPATDSALRMRATYAKAFIVEQFVGDSIQADRLWEQVARDFPGTPFAQQAQRNLGLPVTIVTREDLAQRAFMAAESLYIALAPLATNAPEEYDRRAPEALALYQSVADSFPGTDYAARGLFAAGWNLAYVAADSAGATQAFKRLVKEYPATAYATRGQQILMGQVTISDQTIAAEARALEQARTRSDTAPGYEKKFEDYKQQREKQEKEKEELLWDYNEMYDLDQ